MHTPPRTHRPSILCLHGGGTSGEIFGCQSIQIQRALRDHFNFLFVNGPFASPPGPGVLPVFADCSPYYAWESSGTKQGDTLPDETIILLTETFQACAAAGDEVVGVMGFSQGARVATGLLSWRGHKHFSSLKFGIMLNGSYPAMLPSLLKGSCPLYKISIPTVHIHGLLDQFLAQSRMLLDCHFSRSHTMLLELRIGHQVVSKETSTRLLADAIIDMWEAGSKGTNMITDSADLHADALLCVIS
jgi:predicted esterase